MKTEFLRKFSKDLESIDSQHVMDSIAEVIAQVEQAENARALHQIKKLVGFKNAFRIRVGDYRIGLFIEGDVATFARIVHRKDIYNLFP